MQHICADSRRRLRELRRELVLAGNRGKSYYYNNTVNINPMQVMTVAPDPCLVERPRKLCQAWAMLSARAIEFVAGGKTAFRKHREHGGFLPSLVTWSNPPTHTEGPRTVQDRRVQAGSRYRLTGGVHWGS